MRIPPAPPAGERSRWERWLESIAVSDAGTWYVKNVSPRVDPKLSRWTRGRLTSIPIIPVLLLHHVGARSGQPRVTPLVYFTDGDEVILMASNYGGRKHPAWFHNLKANPEVTLEARGRRGRYRARVTDGEERDRLWQAAKRHTRAYANYETKTDREIPVVALTPLDPRQA